MGLLSALKRLLFSPRLCRVARIGDPAAIADCLTRASVVVVAADLGAPIPLDADENIVCSAVEAATEKKSFDGDIHKYEFAGDSFLPFFTDNRAAEEFCGAYCNLLGHTHVFRVFSIPGAYLHAWIDDQDSIVVNPQSDYETEIDCDKSRAVRGLLPESDSFDDAEFRLLLLPLPGVMKPIEFGPNT